MVKAQEYINKNYPKKTKKDIKFLNIEEKNLTDLLIISDWPQLETINCSVNKITSLTLKNCPNLKAVYTWNNQLNNLSIESCPQISTLRVETNHFTTLDFLNDLNTENLIDLRITNNKQLPFHDLTAPSEYIKKFTNLEKLGLCNMLFTGSLKPLNSLKKLKWLDVRATNFTSGLEYLPENLEEINCDHDSQLAEKLKGCYVNTGQHSGFYCYREWRRKNQELINKTKNNVMTNWQENKYPFKDFNEEITELWKLNNFDKKKTREWLESGLKSSDYDFAKWLVEKKGITPEYFLDKCDYDSSRDDWLESIFNNDEKVSINIAKIENKGKAVEIWDTSDLEKNFPFDREKAKKKIDLLAKLDKGKKIRTKIAEIDPMYWGDIRFTIDKENKFRTWDGTEGCVTFFANDISPYNTWEVGDLIEIDLERLNREKYTCEPLKEKDEGIVELIEKKKKENQTENKKLSKQAKLKLKIKEQEERIKQLEEELAKEKESKRELVKVHKELEKKYGEYNTTPQYFLTLINKVGI